MKKMSLKRRKWRNQLFVVRQFGQTALKQTAIFMQFNYKHQNCFFKVQNNFLSKTVVVLRYVSVFTSVCASQPVSVHSCSSVLFVCAARAKGQPNIVVKCDVHLWVLHRPFLTTEMQLVLHEPISSIKSFYQITILWAYTDKQLNI